MVCAIDHLQIKNLCFALEVGTKELCGAVMSLLRSYGVQMKNIQMNSQKCRWHLMGQ